ncbi:peptidylprolyl isomerase [Spirochaeta cellobiosiphila]|uniref:peptidylprolyl isomerase n=1 Tax=Spirochaeta cellobiosiphila TaxID=504483 RepID=UPI000418DF8E|nr:SurA N-terminal domain-containing protein [Spirochaeta cellobiosiphila]
MASEEKGSSKDKVIQFNNGKNINKKIKTHKKGKKTSFTQVFVIIILALIVVAFVFTPVTGNLASNAATVEFGKYGKTPIEYTQGSYFVNQINIYNNYNQGVFGNNVDLARQFIWRQAFDATVLHTAIMNELNEAHAVISDDTLNKALSFYPGYQDKNGFSQTKYNNTTAAERTSIRKGFKEDLLHQLFVKDVFTGELVSDNEKQFIAELGQTKKAFNFLVWEYSDYPDSEVIAYGQEQSKLFQRLEVSRIIASSEKEANGYLKQIEDGTSNFTDLAQSATTNNSASSTGDLGTKYYYELKLDFTNESDVDSLFALEEGKVSSAYESPLGWVIYQVNKKPAPLDFSEKAGLDVVRTYLSQNEKGKLEDYLVGQATAAQSNYSSLAAASGDLNKTLETTEPFPMNYGNNAFIDAKVSDASDEPLFKNLAYNDNFFEKAYSLPTGSISEPIIESGYIAIFEPISEVTEAVTDTNLEAVESSVASVKQQDFQNLVRNSDKFKDNFYEALQSPLFRTQK